MKKNNRKIGVAIAVVLFAFVIIPSLVMADVTVPSPAVSGGTTAGNTSGGTTAVQQTSIVKLDNPIQANNIRELLLSVVDLAINIGVVVAVLMFVWVGFKFIWAQGNESELSEAKQWFMYVVIGTALLISSKVIVEVVKTTLISTGIVNQQLLNGTSN